MGNGPIRDGSRLGPDELRALEAASRGLTTSEIAVLLGLNAWTVAGLLVRARRVLAAKNTTHAVAEALRAQLIR